MSDPCCAFPQIEMKNHKCWLCHNCYTGGCGNPPNVMPSKGVAVGLKKNEEKVTPDIKAPGFEAPKRW